MKRGNTSFKRVIIHDLGVNYHEMLRTKCSYLIYADGKYAGCQGCFSCWTKHPAKCFIHDKLEKISRIVGQTDELLIITENYYGAYSPSVKTILDRSIGLSTPLSTYRGGEMHHTLRYGSHNAIKVYVYGDTWEQEKLTFKLMVKKNAINYGYMESQVIFNTTPESLIGIIE